VTDPGATAVAGGLRVLRPADAAEAQRLREADPAGTAFVGGGTALQLGWADATPALRLLAVDRLAAAQGWQRVDEGGRPWLRLGAALRLEALRRDPALRQALPLLAAACDTLAAPGVRHLATLGGNVGWRWGDTLAPLLALGAEAELADGRRRPLAALLAAAPLPLVVALWLPGPAAAPRRAVYEKVGRRAAFSPARLALALWQPAGGTLRLAACGAGWVARRLSATEAVLAAGLAPGAAALQPACRADLDGDAALGRLAARLIAGHLGLGAGPADPPAAPGAANAAAASGAAAGPG